MLLAIDATALPPDPVGAGQYTIHLIRALNRVVDGDRLLVYAQPHGRELIGLPESDTLRFTPVPTMSPARRLLWEQTAFPALLRRSGADALLSLHYTMPLRKPLPQVVVFHDMTFFLYPQYHLFTKRHFFRGMIRVSARRADRLVTISESTRQDAIRLVGVPPRKIIAAPVGVTGNFRPVEDASLRERARHKYGLPPRFVLFVGLMEPRKNLDTLLRAFPRVTQTCPDVRLVIAGRKGWGYQQTLRRLEDLGLEGRVHFTGYVAQEDLPALYSLAEIFVYPSWYEGAGMPVLEAMACGAPVVTSNVSSMPEFAGGAGVLVPPGSPEAIAEALIRLLKDPEERRHRSAAGLRRAAEFTWSRTARLVLQACRDTADDEPARR